MRFPDRNKSIIIILLLISFVCIELAVYNYKIRKDNQHKIEELTLSRHNYGSVLEDSYKLLKYSWYLSASELNRINVLKSDQQDSISIYQLLSVNNNKILFYIDNNMCWSCVEDNIGQLAKFKGEIGDKNIIIIAKGFSSRYLNNDPLFQDWKQNIYLTSANIFNRNAHLTDTPIITLIRSDGNVLAGYYSPKAASKASSSFMEFIKMLKQRG